MKLSVQIHKFWYLCRHSFANSTVILVRWFSYLYIKNKHAEKSVWTQWNSTFRSYKCLVWAIGMDIAALLSYSRQRSQLLLHWLDSSLGYDLVCSVFCPVTVLIFAFFLWRKIEVEKRYVGS